MDKTISENSMDKGNFGFYSLISDYVFKKNYISQIKKTFDLVSNDFILIDKGKLINVYKRKIKNNLSHSIFFNSICNDISNIIKSNNIKSIEEKSYKEWVTNIDYLVEDFVIKKLNQISLIQFSFLRERSNINKVINSSSSFTWIIDPIDGTNNLIKDYPFYAVSICG